MTRQLTQEENQTAVFVYEGSIGSTNWHATNGGANNG